MTQSEEYKLKQELERFLFKKKLDTESDTYVQNLMDSEDPVIDKDSFSRIVFYLNTTAATHTPYDQADLSNKLRSDAAPVALKSGLVEESALILVNGKSVRITIGEFKAWYTPRAAYLKFPSDNPENFILTSQKIVWRMVRDYLLILEAQRNGYAAQAP